MVNVFFIHLKEISIFIFYSGARILWRKNCLQQFGFANYIYDQGISFQPENKILDFRQ